MSDAAITNIPATPARSRFWRLTQGMFRVFAPPALRLSGAGIQFLSTVLIARQLGDEKSAPFFFWAAVLTSFAPITTYGLEQLALRNTARMDGVSELPKLQHYLSSVRTFSLGLSFLVGAGLILYAILRGGTLQFQTWHLLLPISLAALSISIINGEALKGLSRPIAGVAFGHFVPVSLFCLLIVFNLERINFPLLLVFYTAAFVAALGIVRVGPIASFRSRIFSTPSRRTVREIVSEGFPVFATNSLGALSYIVPLMLLDFTRPAEEVAYVTTSFRTSILFLLLATAIHGVYAPQLSKAAAVPAGGKGVAKTYLKITFVTVAALAVPMSIGIAFPGQVMSIFGESFRGGAGTLRLLLVSGLLSMLFGPILQLLLMIGKTKWMAQLGMLKLFLVAVLSVVLVPRFGGIGMVISMTVAFTVEEVTGLVLAFRHLRKQSSETGLEA